MPLLLALLTGMYVCLHHSRQQLHKGWRRVMFLKRRGAEMHWDCANNVPLLAGHD